MDDPLSSLEAELRDLRPRRPSAELETRLAAVLDHAAPARPSERRFRSATLWTSGKWASWSFAAAAALVAVMIWRQPRPAATDLANAPEGAGTLLEPVAAERSVVARAPEEWITLADGTRVQRVREYYVDTITWQDPSGAASLQWRVPTEEIRVLPAIFH